jgi:hypothetical protein
MSKSLKEKTFYIWCNERKKEPRRQCKGKTCPLYNDAGYWMHCGFFVAGWCNNSDYGVPTDEPLVTLKDAQQEIEMEWAFEEKLITIACGYSEEITKLKQKLQQTFESYINAYPLENKVDSEVRKVLHKMSQELLKEEKEAKPT